MSKCINTPNIFWKIENYSSVYKKYSPTVRIMELKFRVRYSQFLESGSPKIQLILECQNTSQELAKYYSSTTPWKFLIRAYTLRSSADDRYLENSGTYCLTHLEWCVWSDFVSKIHKSVGVNKYVGFLIMTSPSGNLSTVFNTNESSEEDRAETPCYIKLKEDIGKLFNNKECSDFTLKYGKNTDFFVHKAILSARSEFFAGMFRCDMKESKEKEVKIEKVEKDILEIVLRYMYTGDLPQLSKDSLRKVYAAADMFIIESLKVKCHSLFIDNLKVESEEDSARGTESEQSENEQSEIAEKDASDTKECQMLKDLFESKEWVLFSEDFPEKAGELYKPYLL